MSEQLTDIQKARLHNLQQLVERHPITEGTSGEEDYDAYIEDPTTIQHWATVTQGGENTYVLTHETYEEAKACLIGNIADDLFSEGPIALADLCSGSYWPVDSVIPVFGQQSTIQEPK